VSRQPENIFIASIHKHLPHELYRIKNNNIYNSGQPDCWYSGPAGDLWIEYKFIVLPKRDSTTIKIDLSELQKNWIMSRYSEGRQVGVIVGCKEGGVWMPGLTWQVPYTAESFRDSILGRIALAAIIADLTAR
jgi:hypothetical protein